MTPREYMLKQARGIAGGIAWTRQAFTDGPQLPPGPLVDAAVDIAWERLKVEANGPRDLDITSRDNLIVFRPQVRHCQAAPA